MLYAVNEEKRFLNINYKNSKSNHVFTCPIFRQANLRDML